MSKNTLSEVMNTRRSKNIVTQVIKYKNYFAVLEVDVETDTLIGRVIYTQEFITFRADTVKQAKIEFINSVERHLKFFDDPYSFEENS